MNQLKAQEVPSCSAEPSESYVSWLQSHQKEMAAYEAAFLKNEVLQKSAPREIPLVFHELRKSDGSIISDNHQLTPEKIQQYIDTLNLYFQSINVRFFLSERSFINDSKHYPQIDLGTGRGFFIKKLYSNSIRANSINIYMRYQDVDRLSSIGSGQFPNNSTEYSNVIFLKYGVYAKTLIHEMGHLFGLLHPFGRTNSFDDSSQELVNGSNCKETGDFICDTPASRGVGDAVDDNCSYTGTKHDPAGQLYRPDVGNFMEYAPDRCQDHFTLQQYARMSFILNTFYAHLGTEQRDAQQYCVPTIKYPNHAWITKVRIGNFENTSEKNTKGYQFFSDKVIQLKRGKIYQLDIATRTACQEYKSYWHIMADINKDGDFYDSSESLYNSINVLKYTGESIRQLTIPTDAPLGRTRLRIAMRMFELNDEGIDIAPSPCGNSLKGEVEDYVLEIVENDELLPIANYCLPSRIADEKFKETAIDFFSVENFYNYSDNNQGYLLQNAENLTLQKGKYYIPKVGNKKAEIYYDLLFSEYVFDFSGNTNFNGWLDTNGDGQFATNERQKRFIHVPESALTGNTLLRITSYNGIDSADPCNSNHKAAEYEDYYLKISSSDERKGEIIFPANKYNALDSISSGIKEIKVNNVSYAIPALDPQHTNASDVIIPVVSGVNMNIQISTPDFGSYPETMKLIDINRNGYFDINDKLVNVLEPDLTSTMTAPSAAGDYLMRVYVFNVAGNSQYVDVTLRVTSIEGSAAYECNRITKYRLREVTRLKYFMANQLPFPPVVSRNKSYELSLVNNFGGNVTDSLIWYAWIDFNNDGDFTDAGEKVAESPVVRINQNFKTNISIPTDASRGRQRILVQQYEKTSKGLTIPSNCELAEANKLLNSEYYLFSIESPLVFFDTTTLVKENFQGDQYSYSEDFFIVQLKNRANLTTVRPEDSWLTINKTQFQSNDYDNYIDGSLSSTSYYISYTANNGNEPRTTQVKVTNPVLGGTQTFNFKQAGNALTITRNEIRFDYQGGTENINIISNNPSIKVNLPYQDWLTENLTRTNNGYTLSLKAVTNRFVRNRSLTLWVTDGKYRQAIKISQRPYANSFFETSVSSVSSNNRVIIPALGLADTTIFVNTNQIYYTRFSGDDSWVIEKEGNGLNEIVDSCGTLLRYGFMPNFTGRKRSVTLRFYVLREDDVFAENFRTIIFEQEPSNVTVSTNEVSNESLKLYPNPANGLVWIENSTLFQQLDNEAIIEILSIDGRIVQQSVKTINRFDKIEVHVNNLENGLYFVRLSDSTGKHLFYGRLLKIN